MWDRYRGSTLVIPQEGEVRVAGELVLAGQCALANNLDSLEVESVAKLLIAQAM